MIAEVLMLFPAHIHPLTLVSDPDRLLAGEAVMLELAQRGFRVIQEKDPVFLRARVEEARPFTPQHPVLVITPAALQDLPYDLYQPARRLALSLHSYFPNLAYPLLQALTPQQVEKLASCPPPFEPLSRNKTIDYLLLQVFNADPEALSQPHALVTWLNDYHRRSSPLPAVLRAGLVDRLKRVPVYQDWEMDRLLVDGEAFADFIQQQWQAALEETRSHGQVEEKRPGPRLVFDRDPHLRDLLPALVRQGMLQPVAVSDLKDLPVWAHPGLTLTDGRLPRCTALLSEIEEQVGALKIHPGAQAGWFPWVKLAKDWAELCSLVHQTGLAQWAAQRETFQRLAQAVDLAFSAWLQCSYAPLGAQRLPTPHHVHHVPHYLAFLRSQGRIERLVLLVLDGLSLPDWQVVRSAWTKRHAHWQIETDVLLAQVPTITSISRYALISGLRPADFAQDLDHLPAEARAWEWFWSQEGMPADSCKLMPLSFDRGKDLSPELQDARVSSWCLIDDTPDRLAHHATLGAVDQQTSLSLWLEPAHQPNSAPLEKAIEDFLQRGYAVFLTSDHGHVQASGFGSPSEGLLAQTRGKRARLYRDRLAAERVQSSFPDTILWDRDGILPDGLSALMPAGRRAFAPNGEVVVTHGGISIEEAIVPFVQISKASFNG